MQKVFLATWSSNLTLLFPTQVSRQKIVLPEPRNEESSEWSSEDESETPSQAEGRGKDLISKLLMRDPAERLSAKDALSHPWLTGSSTYPLATGVTVVTKDIRPVKRKAEAAESGSPFKRQRSDSDNNLLRESPDCPSAVPLLVSKRRRAPK